MGIYFKDGSSDGLVDGILIDNIPLRFLGQRVAVPREH